MLDNIRVVLVGTSHPGNIGGAGSLGSGSYAANISNSGNLTFNTSTAQTLSGIVSGTGNLTQNGSNVVVDGKQQMLLLDPTFPILGLILGQAMGGILADTLGWRAAFAGKPAPTGPR